MRYCCLSQATNRPLCVCLVLQVTLAFINAKRAKECGSCGSLLDAVCLQKV